MEPTMNLIHPTPPVGGRSTDSAGVFRVSLLGGCRSDGLTIVNSLRRYCRSDRSLSIGRSIRLGSSPWSSHHRPEHGSFGRPCEAKVVRQRLLLAERDEGMERMMVDHEANGGIPDFFLFPTLFPPSEQSSYFS